MDVYENTSAYVLNNNRTFRTNSRNATEPNTEEEAAAGTGGRVIRLVVVSFGLLCILQASLNVGLRQFLNMSHQNEFEERKKLQSNYSDLQLRFNNQQKEKDELQEMYTVLNMSHQNEFEEKKKLQSNYSDLQIRFNNQQKEKDKLQEMYTVLNMSHQNELEERKKLQSNYSDLQLRFNNQQKEKDELQEMYTVLNMSHQNEFEERKKLQRNYSDLQLSFDNQQKEKDKLQEMYTVLQSRHAKTSEEKDHLEAELQRLYSLSNNTGWHYFQGSFYYGSSTELSWEESRSFCQEYDADLIIINSDKEQAFVMRRYNGRRWIGLSDRETEGVWQWVDGSPISLRFWISGELNESDPGEDCAEMHLPGSNWNDMPCNKTQAFICEVGIHRIQDYWFFPDSDEL